jgi:hypothetical protein
MTNLGLKWEPDAESYVLEHFTNLADVDIPVGAYRREEKVSNLMNRGVELGSLYGEILGAKQWRLDMLKELAWELVKDGRNPMDATFHGNRVLKADGEYLVFWVL